MEDIINKFAMHAYIAYAKTTDFKNYQGLPMPRWEDLGDRIQSAWRAAAREVMRLTNEEHTKAANDV